MNQQSENKTENKTENESKQVESNKSLTHLQIILKAFPPSGYTGSTDGKYDQMLPSAIEKTINHIKNKLPEDQLAKELSLSVNTDGTINGSVKNLSTLISKLSNPLFAAFQKSPFYSGKINNEEELQKAINQTRSGIQNMFASFSRLNELLSEFDSVVKNKNNKELENIFGQINKFKNDMKKNVEVKTE